MKILVSNYQFKRIHKSFDEKKIFFGTSKFLIFIIVISGQHILADTVETVCIGKTVKCGLMSFLRQVTLPTSKLIISPPAKLDNNIVLNNF